MTVDKAGSPLTASENIVPDTRHGVILYVEDVNLSFDGFKALNNLNLYINDGELRCLIGANGAGKTTLMDVITGKIRPDSGKVNFGQKQSNFRRGSSILFYIMFYILFYILL